MAGKQQECNAYSFGGWMYRFRVSVLSDSTEDPLPSCRLSTYCVLIWWKRQSLSLGLFNRELISFMRSSFSWPNHLPKASSPNTITFGASMSIWIWEDKFRQKHWRKTKYMYVHIALKWIRPNSYKNVFISIHLIHLS